MNSWGWSGWSCFFSHWSHKRCLGIVAPGSFGKGGRILHSSRGDAYLVGGWPTPLNNISSSVGMTIPNWMEKENMFHSPPTSSEYLFYVGIFWAYSFTMGLRQSMISLIQPRRPFFFRPSRAARDFRVAETMAGTECHGWVFVSLNMMSCSLSTI